MYSYIKEKRKLEEEEKLQTKKSCFQGITILTFVAGLIFVWASGTFDEPYVGSNDWLNLTGLIFLGTSLGFFTKSLDM